MYMFLCLYSSLFLNCLSLISSGLNLAGLNLAVLNSSLSFNFPSLISSGLNLAVLISSLFVFFFVSSVLIFLF